MAYQVSVSARQAARQLELAYTEYRPKLENVGWLARRNFRQSYSDHRRFCDYTVITESATRQDMFARFNSIMLIDLEEVTFKSDIVRTMVTDWLLGFRYFLPDDAASFIETENDQRVRNEILPWIQMLTTAIDRLVAERIVSDIEIIGDSAHDISRIGDRPLDSIMPPNKHSPAVGVPFLIALRRLANEVSLREADNMIHSIAQYDKRVFWWDARNLRQFRPDQLSSFPELREDTRVFVDPVMLRSRIDISDADTVFYLDSIAQARAVDEDFQATAMNTMAVGSFLLTVGGVPTNYGYMFETQIPIPDWAVRLPLNVDPDMVFTMNRHPLRGDPEYEGLEPLLIRVARRIFGVRIGGGVANALEPDPAPMALNEDDFDSIASSAFASSRYSQGISSRDSSNNLQNAYAFLPNFPPVRFHSAPASVREHRLNQLTVAIARRVDQTESTQTNQPSQLIERKVVVNSPRQNEPVAGLNAGLTPEQLAPVNEDDNQMPVPNPRGIVIPDVPLIEPPHIPELPPRLRLPLETERFYDLGSLNAEALVSNRNRKGGQNNQVLDLMGRRDERRSARGYQNNIYIDPQFESLVQNGMRAKDEAKMMTLDAPARKELGLTTGIDVDDIPSIVDSKVNANPVSVNEDDEIIIPTTMDPNGADLNPSTLTDLGFTGVPENDLGPAVNIEDLDDNVSVVAARIGRDPFFQPVDKSPSASEIASSASQSKVQQAPASKVQQAPASKVQQPPVSKAQQAPVQIVKYKPPSVGSSVPLASERKVPNSAAVLKSERKVADPGSMTLERKVVDPVASARSNRKSVASSTGSNQLEIQSVVSQCASLLVMQLEEEDTKAVQEIYKKIKTAAALKKLPGAFPPLDSKLANNVRQTLGKLYVSAVTATVALETNDTNAKKFEWNQFYALADQKLKSCKAILNGNKLDIVKLQSLLSRDAYRAMIPTMSPGDALVLATKKLSMDPRFAQLVELFTRDADLAVFAADENARAFRRVIKGSDNEQDLYVRKHMMNERGLYLFYVDPRTVEVSVICELLGVEYRKSPSFIFAVAFNLVFKAYVTHQQRDWWYLGQYMDMTRSLNSMATAPSVIDSLVKWYKGIELLESGDTENAMDVMGNVDSGKHIFELIAQVQDELFTALKFSQDRFVLFEVVMRSLMRSVLPILEPNLLSTTTTNLPTSYKAVELKNQQMQQSVLREFSGLDASTDDAYVSKFMRHARLTSEYKELLEEIINVTEKADGLTSKHMETIRIELTKCTESVNKIIQTNTGLQSRNIPVSVVLAHFFVDLGKSLDARKHFEARTRPIYYDSATNKRKEDQDILSTEGDISTDLDIDLSALTKEEQAKAIALCAEFTTAYEKSGVVDDLAAQTIVLKRSRLHSDRETKTMQDRIQAEEKEFKAERQNIVFQKNRRFLLEAMAIVLKERGETTASIEEKTSVAALRVQEFRTRITNISTRVANLRTLVKDIYNNPVPPAMKLDEFIQLKSTAYFQTLNADVRTVVDMLLQATPIDTKLSFNQKLINRLTEVLRELALLNAVLTDIVSDRMPLSGANSKRKSNANELLLAAGAIMEQASMVDEVAADDDVASEHDDVASEYEDASSSSVRYDSDLYSIPSNAPSYSSAKLSALSAKSAIKIEEFKALQDSIKKLQEQALTAPRLLAANFSAKDVSSDLVEPLDEAHPGSGKVLSGIVKADEAYAVLCKQAKDMVKNIETRRSVLSEAASERADTYYTPKNNIVVEARLAVKPPTARNIAEALTPTNEEYKKYEAKDVPRNEQQLAAVNTDDVDVPSIGSPDNIQESAQQQIDEDELDEDYSDQEEVNEDDVDQDYSDEEEAHGDDANQDYTKQIEALDKELQEMTFNLAMKDRERAKKYGDSWWTERRT